MNWRKFAYIMTPDFLRRNDSGNLTTFYNFNAALSIGVGEKDFIPEWNPGISYQTGDRATFKFKVYEALQASTGEMPVKDNQLNINNNNNNAYWKETPFKTLDIIGREAEFVQTFTSQIITLEHYLNARFNNNSPDPYDNNTPLKQGKFIFIEDLTELVDRWIFNKNEPVAELDQVYLYRKWSPIKTYTQGDLVAHNSRIWKQTWNSSTGEEPGTVVNWSFQGEIDYIFKKSEKTSGDKFTVWVPVEVKNSLTPLTSNWEDIIRNGVNFYKFASIGYNIKTF